MSTDTGSMVTREYRGFRGVDFRGEEINLLRSPDALNVWKDYKNTDSIRTRPHMKEVVTTTAAVYGIFFYAGYMIMHRGANLYRYKNEGEGLVKIYEGVEARKSTAFICENIWYFKDGKNYLQYDGTTIKDVVGYVPTTSIGRKPKGGGTIHEDVNMLSPYRINTFLADGVASVYYLDTLNIDSDYTPVITVDDEAVTDFTVDYKKGSIHFAKVPAAPKTDGKDNVKIKYKKTVSGYADNIKKCTLAQVFDNRVFVSGNPDHPNVLWHCSLYDPTYFSDLDYYREGMDEAEIKSLVAGNNALWVFREPIESNTNVFYHTPTIDGDYGKIYPSSHSSIALGCVGGAINFNDDIVFFSQRGMEGISGDIMTEQMSAHRSSLIDRKLLTEDGYANMILEEWNGYLFVMIGKHVYLADSHAMFTNENHLEYEWFYWELEKDITCAKVHEGMLYVGTGDGVYAFTDFKQNVKSYWVTPKDKFNVPHKLKTTNKRGCTVEATGDISLLVKTEDTDFEKVGDYEDIKDYFVSRIKRKKWKDIQLKFYSLTRFSLESATLEAFIGGYIKR